MKLEQKVKVKFPLGLHSRPAAVIVKLLQPCKASVFFTCRGEKINAKSILSILMLAAKKDDHITITVDGIDAEATMKQLLIAFERAAES